MHPRYKLSDRSDACFRALAIGRDYINFYLILHALWCGRRGLRGSSGLGDRLCYSRMKQVITGRLDRYDVVILCYYLISRTPITSALVGRHGIPAVGCWAGLSSSLAAVIVGLAAYDKRNDDKSKELAEKRREGGESLGL